MSVDSIAKRPVLTFTWFHAVPLVVSAVFALMEQWATGLLADYFYACALVFALLTLGLARQQGMAGEHQ
jgi:hypothetical protein